MCGLSVKKYQYDGVYHRQRTYYVVSYCINFQGTKS